MWELKLDIPLRMLMTLMNRDHYRELSSASISGRYISKLQNKVKLL